MHEKNRRGGTLVMVAFMLVPLMAVAAIAADIGRFYVVTGELQTAADAAALHGAMTLQKTSGTNPEATVDAAVMAYVAANNRADNAALSVAADAVRMAFWTPKTANVAATLSYTFTGRPNAVSVRVASAPKGIFSQIIGQITGVPISREATAWIANLPLQCVRPWVMPYTKLYEAVTGFPPSIDTLALPAGDFANYMQLDTLDARRRFLFIGPPPTTTTQTTDGYWRAFGYGGNAGKPDFVNGITDCNQYSTSADAAVNKTLPSQGAIYDKWATDGVTTGGGTKQNPTPPLCILKTTDNGCYSSTTAVNPGVTINVAWGDDGINNGSSAVRFRYVGEFVFQCYYTGATTTNGCLQHKTGYLANGYPEGTIVGFVKKLKSSKIEPTDLLGNKVSNNQRIILVR